MKNIVFKTVALIIAAVLFVAVFSSCKDENTSGETDPGAVSDTYVSETDTSDTSDEQTSFADGNESTASASESQSKGDVYAMLEGKTPYLADGVYTVRDLSYGKRVDLSGRDPKASSQIFDLYLPSKPEELPKDAKTFLYLHGGAWSETTSTKDNDSLNICRELAESGIIVVSMNYILAGSATAGDSVDGMMNDITEMLGHLKKLLTSFGVKADACGLGGYSAGGHLSALYAYRYGNTAPMRIAFEADIAGPVDVTVYKPVIDAIIEVAGPDMLFSQSTPTSQSFTKIFGSMVNMKNMTANDLPALWSKMSEYDATGYVNKNSCPSILAYGKSKQQQYNMLPDGFESDGMVPVECYTKLSDKLKANGVKCSAKLFDGIAHGEMTSKSPAKEWIADQIKQFSKQYL